MDHLIGKMLDDRYEILELIGTGGMANVYKAKDHRLNRMDAIKVLKSDLAGDSDFKRRFHDESQAVAQLSHANIVSVYDVSSSDHLDYIVMELIDGITLKQYMERRGQMDWREALHFISQIMRGLSHAHSRGLIHRDIKPHNIMVLRDGSVKVADFGIACLETAGQTLTQEALGSVHYISPEQARGDRLDARSDIYSAGVVLYEMLTGRLPFEGDSAVSVAIQHLSSVPLTPREINPSVPEALELICMKAMNPDANKRYANADQMVHDLDQFKKDPNINMEYIRTELTKSDVPVSEPTQPIPVVEVVAAVKGETPKTQEKVVVKKPDVPVKKKPANSGKDPFNNKKLMYGVIGGFAVALVLIFVIFKVIFGGFGKTAEEPTQFEVPNILGYTVEEAESLVTIKDTFTINVLGMKESDKYQPGQIIEQDPKAGEIRKPGLEENMVIDVYLCAETEVIYMPTVVGEEYQQAKVLLKNLKLDLVITDEEDFSDEYEEGKICRVEPEVGTELKKGDSVKLVISKGKEKMTVPECIGLPYTEALTLAKAEGFVVNTDYVENEAENGTVIEQSLEPNTKVDNGTELTLTVSKGQSTVSNSISFTAPNTYNGNTYVSLKVDVLAGPDGKVVYSSSVTPGQSYTVQVSGTKGNTITVEAKYTGYINVQTTDPTTNEVSTTAEEVYDSASQTITLQ